MPLFDDVKEVVVEQLNVTDSDIDYHIEPPKECHPTPAVTNFLTKFAGQEYDLINDDSLDVLELIRQLEEKYNINIPDDQEEAIATVKDAIKFIESQKDSNGKQLRKI
jgi:acyl carrier protein